MGEVYRIQDRFKITGRGYVYAIKVKRNSNIRLNDVLFDLQGNRFRIKGITHFSPILFQEDRINYPEIGVLLEPLDGNEVEGKILLKNPADISFIFCNHPLYPRQVDEDYKEEYQEAGLNYPCALFSYEDLEKEDKLSLFGEEISGLTIYRGWMMKPEMYKRFYEKLEERGIILINSPEEYERYHTLPGWYNDFKEFTPESVWEDKGTLESALDLTMGLSGSYIVKDYVKSRKHEWYDACYIQSITDTPNVKKTIGNFIERQGDSLVGGVVLRKYVKLKPIGYHEKSGMPISEEYRVFAFGGRMLIFDKYWKCNEEIGIIDDLPWILSVIDTKIRSNFVTIDLARSEDGDLIILELGDGQVSGLQQIDPKEFYKSFDPNYKLPYMRNLEPGFPEGAVIMVGDPYPGMSVEDMQSIIFSIKTTEELIDAYVKVHNKFFYIEDEVYDYEEGTEEYEKICAVVDAWGNMMDNLDKRVMKAAAEEGLLAERQPNSGTVKQLEAFMDKYGYRDGCGWWVKKG